MPTEYSSVGSKDWVWGASKLLTKWNHQGWPPLEDIDALGPFSYPWPLHLPSIWLLISFLYNILHNKWANMGKKEKNASNINVPLFGR